MFRRLLELLYPSRCILCRKFLTKEETDLCPDCRKNAPEFTKAKSRIPFVAGWTALWYYKDNPRQSVLRFKFGNKRHYALAYGRLLGIRLLKDMPEGFDFISYVPTGRLRVFKRGYDQAKLVAAATASELGFEVTSVLKKIRNTPPQSRIQGAARRRANVLGAYAVIDPAVIRNKRILLLDDVITTGATCSECAKTLLIAGAKEVYCAAVAASSHDKK